MQNLISLKSAERKAFQVTFADGLWDVFLGCVVLEFAIAPLLSESLGDFWSSFVFLPFWGLVYLAIWLTRKFVIAPRLGTVSFGKPRQKKLLTFTIIMVIINAITLFLGLVSLLVFDHIPGGIWVGILALLILLGFSAAAYLLDYPRLYFYGLLLMAAPLVGEWLYTAYGMPHHGFPLVFGLSAGLIILIGLGTFVRLLKNAPIIELPDGA